MKKGSVAALIMLGGIVLGLGFFATPLMKHARAYTWNIVVLGTARIFGIERIDVSDTEIDIIKKLSHDNIRLTSELGDYRKLKNQLGTPAFDSMKKIPAAIISRPLDTLTSQYIINKGIADGVPEGAPVVVMGSVLVGFTRGLSSHASTVETLFAKNTSVTVETVPKDEDSRSARGLLESRFQTSLEMNTIPRDIPLTEGQSVVTSNKEPRLPYGIVIGTISSFEKPENEAYQHAAIDVPYRIDALDAVVVLVAP